MDTRHGRIAPPEISADGRGANLPWTEALERVDPWSLAIGIGVCIVVLGALGVADVLSPGKLSPFNLDGEYNFPATFSALLDFGAAVGAEALRRRTGRNVLFGLVVLFAFMGCDEFSALHERLESLTGIDWMKLYVPVFAYAAVAWVAVLRAIRDRLFWLCMLGGAGAWAVAQVFELLEWNGDVRRAHYNSKMVPEELLEMTGSALFLLGMLVALRAYRRRSARPVQ